MNKLQQIHSKIYLLNSKSFAKPENKKVVFTNGCFDILHKGHVEYLAQASELGDYLIVGINSDASVKAQNKGVERPINSIEGRSAVLAGLGFVDAVIEFDAETPLKLIENILPDVLVKGADYNPDQTDPNSKDYIVGKEAVLKNGGQVKVIDLIEGYSTTNIVNKLNK